VQNVKLAFEILHPEHRVQFLGEHRAAAVRMKADDAALRGVGRRADVHRIFRHEHAPIRRNANDGRVTNGRRLRHQLHAPARKRRGRGGWQLDGQEKTQREDEVDAAEFENLLFPARSHAALRLSLPRPLFNARCAAAPEFY
jgi:hypothetical protein